MCRTDRSGNGESSAPDSQPDADQATFSALLEDSAEDLYEHAPCGYLSTTLDGRIAKINQTLLNWLGYENSDLVGRKDFADLLTVGGRLYHETHFGPLLRMQGEIRGIALELRTAGGGRLPVLVTSVVRSGSDGQPLLIRTTVFDARDRRTYESELLRARQESDRERERLKRLNATLQKTLLPPTLVDVPGLDVAAYYHVASADEVGGDFYDLFPLDSGTWGFFLGDVCGKGAAAAAVTSLARYTLRAAAVYDPDPAAVLANLNTVLNHEYNGDDPRFCTVIFGLLTPDGDAGGFQVTLASGGHPPALLMRSDGHANFLPTPAANSSASCPTPTSPPPPSASTPATRCSCTPTVSPKPTRRRRRRPLRRRSPAGVRPGAGTHHRPRRRGRDPGPARHLRHRRGRRHRGPGLQRAPTQQRRADVTRELTVRTRTTPAGPVMELTGALDHHSAPDIRRLLPGLALSPASNSSSTWAGSPSAIPPASRSSSPPATTRWHPTRPSFWPRFRTE